MLQVWGSHYSFFDWQLAAVGIYPQTGGCKLDFAILRLLISLYDNIASNPENFCFNT
jgi:hypothetical protein